MTKIHNLSYYVYVENTNKRKIEKYNVLNGGIINEIKERTKGITDKKVFAEKVAHIMMYHYWSKSEWEIVLTDWPTHVKVEELKKTVSEIERYQKEYDQEPKVLCINLSTEKKIDVYEQITLNWSIFINYVWENLKGKC